MANDNAYRVDADELAVRAYPFGLGVYSDPPTLGCTGVPGSATHPVARLESVVLRGHPMQPRLLTIAGGVTALADYPHDGSGIARAGDTGRIRFAADMPPIDARGLVVLCVKGACAGQFAYIVTHDSGTGWADVLPTWLGEVPDGTTEYAVLFPTWGRNQVHLITEFESPFADAGSATILHDAYSVGWLPPASGKYAGQLGVLGAFGEPWRVSGLELTVQNRDRTRHSKTTGYRAGGIRTDECRGNVGSKFVLRGAPATGRLVIAGAST